jgi:hypothetical protein
MRKFLISAEAYENAPYPWNPHLRRRSVIRCMPPGSPLPAHTPQLDLMANSTHGLGGLPCHSHLTDVVVCDKYIFFAYSLISNLMQVPSHTMAMTQTGCVVHEMGSNDVYRRLGHVSFSLFVSCFLLNKHMFSLI